jgi:magnesium-transporting ATPase (P-type)
MIFSNRSLSVFPLLTGLCLPVPAVQVHQAQAQSRRRRPPQGGPRPSAPAYINGAERTNAPPGARFPDNKVRTTKYSLFTFLPRNLYEQFHRVAYIYFLVLAALNFVPQLGVFTPAAAVLPLAFVIGVLAVKDAYADRRRHRSDKTENGRAASVLVNGVFVPKRWEEVRVGEVLRVTANETLPCDMVLLSTSDSTGVAYVQTINLDGESNLKTRYAKQETLPTPPEALTGVIKCEQPNRNIYGFLGTVDLDGRHVPARSARPTSCCAGASSRTRPGPSASPCTPAATPRSCSTAPARRPSAAASRRT